MKTNSRLRKIIQQVIIQLFLDLRRGVYYEELANRLGVSIAKVSFELDYIADEDIRNGDPPLDALVVLKNTGIPAPEHFERKLQYIRSQSWGDYYQCTVALLSERLNVVPDAAWLNKIKRALR